MALRPWHSTMRVYEFSMECSASTSMEDVIAQRRYFEEMAQRPFIDLSKETWRHSFVAEGTEEVYQGHPTTTQLGDGTLLAVWCINHGGHAGPMARSIDSGKSWQRMDDLMPKGSWNHSCNHLRQVLERQAKELCCQRALQCERL